MVSYRKSHIKNKIHKIKPKKSIFKKLWFWLAILVFIIVISGFYFFLFYPGLQLKNIVISGNNEVSTQDLQKLIFENAGTGLVKFWKINITSSSIFLVNQGNLNKDILKEFPEIKNVKINKELPQTISIGVTERKAVGVYCNSQADNQQCFLIDGNGVIFEQGSNPSDNFVVIRQSFENKSVFVGEDVISQNIIDAIYKIQKALKDNFQIDLKEALVASPTSLNIETGENWQIYFDLSGESDINSQITKLDLLLRGGISADSRKNLKYIDLRPQDRAIICDNKTCESQ